MNNRVNPITHMRIGTEVFAAVKAIAEEAGLPVGQTVEMLCAEALGIRAPNRARAELVRVAVRNYRRGHSPA